MSVLKYPSCLTTIRTTIPYGSSHGSPSRLPSRLPSAVIVLVVVSRDSAFSWARVAGSHVSILSQEGVLVSLDAWASSWDRSNHFQGNQVRRGAYVRDFLWRSRSGLALRP
jgi:hypothetical protein